MPTTVTATDGSSIHLWQLHEDSSRDVSPSIEFNEIRNDLGDGYRAQMLFGADTGTRSWNITLPTLAGSSVSVPTVTSITGDTVTREQYLWDLYCETRITGEPFAFTCPRDGMYYLVDFANPKLTYEKEFRVALYSSGIELRQVREPGVSLHDPWLQLNMQNYDGGFYDNTGHSSPNWLSRDTGAANQLTDALSTASFGAATQNSRNIVRLNPSGSASRLDSSSGAVYDVFFVMKVREATFSNTGALFGTSSTAKLKGTTSGTKWQNPSHTGLRYWLNGLEYAVTDMQAPMNEWGVVHVRSTTALVASNMSIGAETSSNGLKADIAEIHYYTSGGAGSQAGPMSLTYGRQLEEHLAIKWGIA